MTYARLCEHGEVKAHTIGLPYLKYPQRCPGGSVLPDDTLVIVTESIPDGGGSDYVGIYWPRWACDALEALLRKRGCYPPLGPPRSGFVGSEDILDALAAAQGSQE